MVVYGSPKISNNNVLKFKIPIRLDLVSSTYILSKVFQLEMMGMGLFQMILFETNKTSHPLSPF